MDRDFNDILAADLCDPEFAAAYLEECLAFEEPETFLLALRDVIKANPGMSEVARQLEASRPSLYKALSDAGNPEFRTVQAVLKSVGLRLSVAPIEELRKAA